MIRDFRIASRLKELYTYTELEWSSFDGDG